MSEESTKVDAVRYWSGKALESLAAARRELAADAYAFAINRAYYALFYAVSALLLEEGHQFAKHSGCGMCAYQILADLQLAVFVLRQAQHERQIAQSLQPSSRSP